MRIPLAVLRTGVAAVVQGMATLICGSYLIVALKIRPNSPQVPRVMRIWARVFLFVTGTRVTVEGAERVDPAGSYVFVGNHTSNLDIPVIMARLPVSIRFLAKKELFKVPVLGGAMRAIHMVETDRRLGPSAHRSINRQVATVIERGLSLMIFPEGTRSDDGRMLPFKKGAFRIAVDNSMPVVPVTIVGAHEGWKPHSKLIFGAKVRLVIHDPIPAGHDISEMRDLARREVAGPFDGATGD